MPSHAATFSTAPASGGDPTTGARTLILYDTTNQWGYLGEFYAIYNANLAGHFGAWTAKPIGGYVAGELASYTAAVYVGSTYDEPIPTAFLDDVLAGTKPVMWMGYNIWQLASRSSSFASTYGYTPGLLEFTGAHAIAYKGQLLDRGADNDTSGLLTLSGLDSSVAQVLAMANRVDGSQVPWAVRSHNLTYVVENPIPYAREGDRVLSLADFYFDALAPQTTERHRALLRLEDVNPADDLAPFQALVDWLYSQSIPFCVGVIPVYTDPLGYYNGGKPQTIKTRDAKAFVDALKYAQAHGGTLLMHGYTHQYDKTYDPYSAVTGDDFEFYRTHLDPTTFVVTYDGPVSQDTSKWASNRFASGLDELKRAGFARPAIFEFPHYAASKVDYTAARSYFGTRYERSLYFIGQLSGGAPSYGNIMGQYFPYVVTDVYGSKVLPENLGAFEPNKFYATPPRYPSEIVRAAGQNLVVRDGFASTFFHPYNFSHDVVADDGVTRGDDALKDVVNGIRQLGYTFVSCSSL